MLVKLKLFIAMLRRVSSRARAKLARKFAALARGATKLLAAGTPGKLGYRLCQVAIAMAMAAGIAGGIGGVVHAQTGTFQISRDNVNAFNPQVAKDTDGDAVVVWGSPDSSSGGIFMRRLNSYNQNASGVLPVNSCQDNDQYSPNVAIDADGDFVVVWAGYGFSISSTSNSQFDNEGIFAQRFDANGVMQGRQYRVNSTTAFYQGDPSVAMDADGNFVVVWESAQSATSSDIEIIGRRFNADGTAASGEFTVNEQGNSQEVNPDIAMDLSGDFVVVFQSDDSTSNSSSLYYSGDEVYGQRYDNTGVAQGNNFRVNQVGSFDQQNPAVSMDADGDFVVVWTGRYNYSSRWISFGTFDAAGVLVSGDTSAQDNNYDREDSPAVDMDDDGNFIVAWQAYDSFSSSWAVRAQFFDADGSDWRDEFSVNGFQYQFTGTPAVALDSDGDYVIAYMGWNSGDYLISASVENVSNYSASGFNSTGASPRVGNVYVSNDHHRIEDGERLAQNNITTLIVTFSEEMDKASVENTGNWTLTRDGAPVAISSVLSSKHFLRNRQEAQINLASALGDGNYVLTLSDAVLDENDGAQLDGDNDGAATGDFVRSFTVNAAEKSSGELRVNTVTANEQVNCDIAMDANGDYVVVWQSYRYDSGPSTSTWDVLAQRYSAGGSPVGGVITVNTNFATGDQTRPAVAMDADGNFVVAWQANAYGNSYISAHMFYSDGTSNGGSWTVVTNNNGCRDVDVAMDSDGDFVVIWSGNYSSLYSGPSSAPGQYYDWDIVGVTYDRFGNSTGGGVLNNNTRTHNQTTPAVSMDADGDFVAAWADDSVSFYGSGYGIMAMQIDRHGNPMGGFFSSAEFPVVVGQGILRIPLQPAVAMDADGDFVVAWTELGYAFSYYSGGPVPLAAAVKTSRFSAAGVQQGALFSGQSVNTDGRVAINPSIAMDADGDYVVTWTATDGYIGISSGSGGISVYALRSEVYSRRFNAEGDAQENDVQVNSFVNGMQGRSSAAMDSDGDYVIVWQSGPSPYTSSSSASQDGDGTGIYMQRFDENSAPTTSGISDVVVDEDDDPIVVNLASAFADAEDPDAALAFAIVNNTNPGLVGAGLQGSQLGLAFFADGNGTADITIRCTDTGGLWVEDTFTVTVNAVAEPLPPDTGGDDDSGCVAATTGAAPWGLLAVLFAAFGSFKRLVRREQSAKR